MVYEQVSDLINLGDYDEAIKLLNLISDDGGAREAVSWYICDKVVKFAKSGSEHHIESSFRILNDFPILELVASKKNSKGSDVNMTAVVHQFNKQYDKWIGSYSQISSSAKKPKENTNYFGKVPTYEP